MRKLFTTIAFPIGALLFGALLIAERRRPLRRPTRPKGERLIANVELAAATGVAIQLVFLPVMTRTARFVERHGVGLLPRLRLPRTVETMLAVLLLDYSYYWWHRMLHHLPLLWRFHTVHHTDLDLDVSTAIRFHFGEWILSTPFRAAQVLAFGASERAAAIFETAMIASILFHHSNLRLPFRLERLLALLVVTPRAHGIHHSVVRRERDSNFSTLLIGWDRLHRTFRFDIPQSEITIGLPAYRNPRALRFARLLTIPFSNRSILPAGELPLADPINP